MTNYRRQLMRSGIAVSAAIGVAAGLVMVTRPSAELRYHLEVGQEVTYRDHWHAVVGGKAQEKVSTFAFRVIGRTPDGAGWRLATKDGASWLLTTGMAPDEPTALAIWPNGRIGAKQLRPVLFPPLPSSADAGGSWEDAPNGMGNTDTYRRVPTTRPADAQSLALAMESHSVFDGPYDDRDRDTTLFDPAGGLVVREIWHHENGEGDQRCTIDDEMELVGTATTRPAAWTADYARQVDATIAAREAYLRALPADAKRPTTGPTTRLSDLAAVRRMITDPTLAAGLDRLAARDGPTFGYLRLSTQGSDAPDSLVGRPAPDWTMTDLDGRTHKLADLRGQVVVLDFWYLMCPYCIRAMPQVKQLSLDYAGKPVCVFGVNTDDTVAEARKAVDTLGLPYPQLRASMRAGTTTRPAVPADYHVQGYPTLFVIGPDGVVRHVEVGYSPDLRVAIARQINALLRALSQGSNKASGTTDGHG